MLRRVNLAALGFLLTAGLPASSQDLMPLDTTQVDEGMMLGVFGPWHVRDESGEKDCPVMLGEEPAGNGRKIDVDPVCTNLFPVMGKVASWQLYESWVIDIMDAEGKTLIRFTTPDERYVAEPETDGIATIEMEFDG